MLATDRDRLDGLAAQRTRFGLGSVHLGHAPFITPWPQRLFQRGQDAPHGFSRRAFRRKLKIPLVGLSSTFAIGRPREITEQKERLCVVVVELAGLLGLRAGLSRIPLVLEGAGEPVARV